jgi:hypothetical protein
MKENIRVYKLRTLFGETEEIYETLASRDSNLRSLDKMQE